MNRDQLIEHLENKHEKYICNTCNIACASENDLNKHILEEHRSHKPCRDFATISCTYKSECRYRHIKLKENQHICYTCGVKTSTLKDLMVHIKDAHGSQPCTKFVKGQCDRQSRCWYSHSKLPNINANLPQPTARQVFFQKATPTSHPQLRAKCSQVSEAGSSQQKQMHQVLIGNKNQKLEQATHAILSQMMPTLVQKIIETLNK